MALVINEKIDYVARDLTPTSQMILENEMNKYGLSNFVPDFHVTLIFSRTRIDINESDLIKRKDHIVGTGKMEKWEDHEGNDIIVLVLDDNDSVYTFSKRNEFLLSRGGTNSYPEYRPHITLTKKPPIGYNVPDDKIIISLAFGEKYINYYG